MKDKTGREIVGGDFIIYGQARGRTAALNWGHVISTQEDRLRFVGTDRWNPKKVQKESTLRSGTDRLSPQVLVIPWDSVPASVRHTLLGYADV